MRAVAPLDLPEVVPAAVSDRRPEFRIVSPSSLLIDEQYQRNLSARSMRLIRRIIAEWSWAAFKPPVVVEVAGELHVVDGQHTALAASSHPAIDELPVMVIAAEEAKDRAEAFVRHNRDRISVTPTQLHHAEVVAGNEDALTLQQVCARAGVTVLRSPPSSGRFKPGDTLSVSALASLINRRHAMGARRVLEVCAQARLAPISVSEIRAVEWLLFGEGYAGDIEGATISAILLDREALEAEARRFSAERKVPLWRALASVIFMRKERGHG